MPRRFLMLTTREQDDLAISERSALLKYTGLDNSELLWARLESEPFPSIDFSKWDGIILCGSRFDVSIPEDHKSLRQREIEQNLLKLLSEIERRDFPFLGLCYGLGMLARLLGGKVDRQYPEDISGPVLSLTSEGRRDPLLEGIPWRFNAYVGHHEAVSRVPAAMTTLVSGQECPIQMVRVKKNLYATQFHPELDLDGINFRINIFADAGYYPISERAEVESRVRNVDTESAHLILSNFIQVYGSELGAA